MFQVQNVSRLEFLTANFILLSIDCYKNIDSLYPHLPLKIVKFLKEFYCTSKTLQQDKFLPSIRSNCLKSSKSNTALDYLFELIKNLSWGESLDVSLNFGQLIENIPVSHTYKQKFHSGYCIPCFTYRTKIKPNFKQLSHLYTNININIFPPRSNPFECMTDLVCCACRSYLKHFLQSYRRVHGYN